MMLVCFIVIRKKKDEIIVSEDSWYSFFSLQLHDVPFKKILDFLTLILLRNKKTLLVPSKYLKAH